MYATKLKKKRMEYMQWILSAIGIQFLLYKNGYHGKWLEFINIVNQIIRYGKSPIVDHNKIIVSPKHISFFIHDTKPVDHSCFGKLQLFLHLVSDKELYLINEKNNKNIIEIKIFMKYYVEKEKESIKITLPDFKLTDLHLQKIKYFILYILKMYNDANFTDMIEDFLKISKEYCKNYQKDDNVHDPRLFNEQYREIIKNLENFLTEIKNLDMKNICTQENLITKFEDFFGANNEVMEYIKNIKPFLANEKFYKIRRYMEQPDKKSRDIRRYMEQNK